MMAQMMQHMMPDAGLLRKRSLSFIAALEGATAKRSQKTAMKLLTMMNALAVFTQERHFALYWLRTPQKELGGATALAWMQEGHLDDVINYVAALSRYQPD